LENREIKIPPLFIRRAQVQILSQIPLPQGVKIWRTFSLTPTALTEIESSDTSWPNIYENRQRSSENFKIFFPETEAKNGTDKIHGNRTRISKNNSLYLLFYTDFADKKRDETSV
jgi:hypothetical protein